MGGLEARHLADLTFPEVSRSLRALSSTYVERRETLARGAALAGAGKRAAFALFYGPLHFLLVRHIVESLPGAVATVPAIVDLGCGTGVSGAAWARACTPAPEVFGVDRHPWAVHEARETYRAFALRGRVHVGDFVRARLPERSALVAAFALNELPPDARHRFLRRVLAHARSGGRLLIVEPLAGQVAPWWDEWRRAVEGAGGRADNWRVRSSLPPIVQKLDRAAGLDHRELTARTLFVASG
jgi:SAM-dependent methyltransferase